MSDEGGYRRDDPWTSKKAARELEASRLEGICWRALCERPISGMTTHEIKDATGLEYGSVTPRMVKLEEKGLAERRYGPDGKELTRIPAGRTKPGIIFWPIIRKEETDVATDTSGTGDGGMVQTETGDTDSVPVQRVHNKDQLDLF